MIKVRLILRLLLLSMLLYLKMLWLA